MRTRMRMMMMTMMIKMMLELTQLMTSCRDTKWGQGLLYYPSGRLMFRGEMRLDKILRGQTHLTQAQ